MRLCSLPAQERTISLDTIGQKTKLEVDGVEFLLMKTLSLHLIEGIVDQVDGNVKVHSETLLLCLPRVSFTTATLIYASKCTSWEGIRS